jgi:hypothetical protein
MCNIWVIVRSALMGPPNSASQPAVIGPGINRSGHINEAGERDCLSRIEIAAAEGQKMARIGG